MKSNITNDMDKVSTHVLSFTLRMYAEQCYKRIPGKAKMLIAAANRLDDQAERIAIMSEPEQATDAEMAFPPQDDEIKGDEE